MNFESFFKGVGQKIANSAESVRANREARLRSPEFQRTLLESRNKMVEHLTNAGTKTLEAALKLLITSHASFIGNLVKEIFVSNSKKNPSGEYVEDIQKGFSDVILAVKSAIFLIGRGTVHFGRWLLAK